MGLSQQIGASSLIKPGVIDNSTQRPASPYEGQVIFQKDTDQLLVWNGTAWVIPNQKTTNPEGLELVATGVLATATTDILGCFTSDYKNYKIIIPNPTVSSAADIYFKMLQGTTPISANYDYATTGLSTANLGVSNVAVGAAEGYTGFTCSAGLATVPIGSVIMDICSPAEAKVTVFTGIIQGYQSTSYVVKTSMIAHGQAIAFTGLRVSTLTAATLTGTYAIYGYRNS